MNALKKPAVPFTLAQSIALVNGTAGKGWAGADQIIDLLRRYDEQFVDLLEENRRLRLELAEFHAVKRLLEEERKPADARPYRAAQDREPRPCKDCGTVFTPRPMGPVATRCDDCKVIAQRAANNRNKARIKGEQSGDNGTVDATHEGDGARAE